MESHLARSAGSRGPAGGVMGSIIVPAVWIGWRERWRGRGWVKGWGEKPWKKKRRGGDTSITCALPDPSFPPSVSPQTEPLSERRGIFPQADAHPPPLFEIAFSPFLETWKLNCDNLFLFCVSPLFGNVKEFLKRVFFCCLFTDKRHNNNKKI